jgi:hypothetical protein
VFVNLLRRFNWLLNFKINKYLYILYYYINFKIQDERYSFHEP